MMQKIDMLFFHQNYRKLTSASIIIEKLKQAKTQAKGGAYEQSIDNVINKHVDYFIQRISPISMPLDDKIIMESIPEIYGELLLILTDPAHQ